MSDAHREIYQRLDALESKVGSESSLRAMMDQDQATLTTRLDVQDNLLRALSVTQSEHTARLTGLEDGVRHLAMGQVHLAEGQTRLETKVNVLTIRMSNLDFKVTEGQEHLAEGLTHLNERQTRLEAGQSRMETSLQTVLTLLQAGSG
jgi:chromosome segregation ATPase